MEDVTPFISPSPRTISPASMSLTSGSTNSVDSLSLFDDDSQSSSSINGDFAYHGLPEPMLYGSPVSSVSKPGTPFQPPPTSSFMCHAPQPAGSPDFFFPAGDEATRVGGMRQPGCTYSPDFKLNVDFDIDFDRPPSTNPFEFTGTGSAYTHHSQNSSLDIGQAFGQQQHHGDLHHEQQDHQAGARVTSQTPPPSIHVHKRRRSNPVAILPNPSQLHRLEEQKAKDQAQRPHHGTHQSRARRAANTKSIQMERETLMVALLKEQNIPWSEIVKKVNSRYETNHTASCLQMRLSRWNRRVRSGTSKDDDGM